VIEAKSRGQKEVEEGMNGGNEERMKERERSEQERKRYMCED
jgi:hypothetical protein